MRKIAMLLLTGVFAVTTLMLAGCAGSEPPKDFWGNPVDPGDPQHCAVPSGPAVPPDILLNPRAHQRPKSVRPGNSWVVIEYELRALPATLNGGTGFEYCVPADVHVYAQPGDADVTVYGVDSFDVGPFDFAVQTPWIGRFIFLQYDPNDGRFASRPPSYKITMDAKYVPEKDVQSIPPFALGCKLKIDGGIRAQDIAIIQQRSQVQCKLTANTYHTYDY
jgi:hypothetical protein